MASYYFSIGPPPYRNRPTNNSLLPSQLTHCASPAFNIAKNRPGLFSLDFPTTGVNCLQTISYTHITNPV